MRLAEACRRNRLEFLLEIIPSRNDPVDDPVDDETTARVIQRFYDIGVFPDWWKLEPMKTEAAWANATAAIARNDPHCRGVVALGLDAPAEDLAVSFAIAARFELVKGFAIGRTIFSDTARDWFSGTIDDAAAVTRMAGKFRALCDIWDEARKRGKKEQAA